MNLFGINNIGMINYNKLSYKLKKLIYIFILLFIFVISFGKTTANANLYSEYDVDFQIKVAKYLTYLDEKYKDSSTEIKLKEFKKIEKGLKKVNKNDNQKVNFIIKVINLRIKSYKEILKKENFKRVAHAGGEYNGKTYTNSLNALEKNKKYFNYFEIDFSWTSDNKLVCIHDWSGSFYKAFGFHLNGYVPSYDEFNSYINDNSKFKNCTLDTLIIWLDLNKKASIITDVKTNNLKALEYIRVNYPEYTSRFIPQIYDPKNYIIAKKLGYENIIWTLYKYKGSLDSVLIFLKEMDLFALTTNTDRILEGILKKLNNENLYIYTHTINNISKLDSLKKSGVDEIYTDSLFN